MFCVSFLISYALFLMFCFLCFISYALCFMLHALYHTSSVLCYTVHALCHTSAFCARCLASPFVPCHAPTVAAPLTPTSDSPHRRTWSATRWRCSASWRRDGSGRAPRSSTRHVRSPTSSRSCMPMLSGLTCPGWRRRRCLRRSWRRRMHGSRSAAPAPCARLRTLWSRASTAGGRSRTGRSARRSSPGSPRTRGVWTCRGVPGSPRPPPPHTRRRQCTPASAARRCRCRCRCRCRAANLRCAAAPHCRTRPPCPPSPRRVCRRRPPTRAPHGVESSG